MFSVTLDKEALFNLFIHTLNKSSIFLPEFLGIINYPARLYFTFISHGQGIYPRGKNPMSPRGFHIGNILKLIAPRCLLSIQWILGTFRFRFI